MEKHKIKNLNKGPARQNVRSTLGGYAILFTVIIMSVILTITMGMANLAYKELILSSVARDSQIAFYQADTASECGLYADLKYPGGLSAMAVASSWKCGIDSIGNSIILNVAEDSPEEYRLFPVTQKGPAFNMHFYKTPNVATGGVDTKLEAKGYNNYDFTDFKTVERMFEITY